MLRHVALLSVALAAFGCDSIVAHTGDEGMLVLGNTAIAAGGSACTFTGAIGQPYISTGEISTLSQNPYLFTPLLESNITAGSGVDPITRTIELQGADVTLGVASVSLETGSGTFPSPQPTVTLSGSNAAFQSPFSGSLAPNLGTLNVAFPIVPLSTIAAVVSAANPGAGDHLHVTLQAHITVFGDLGGSRIDALPFDYPVTICNDCVVDNVSPCPLMSTPSLGNPCNMYQDGIVDCCTTGSGSSAVLTCPGTTGSGGG